MSAQIVLAMPLGHHWRDWKGDLVPGFAAFVSQSIRVTIPAELANEASLLTYLGVNARELKKIWYFRHRMYRHFSISKRSDKIRLISAPDPRLKFLQSKIATKLDEIYRPRKSVHGFVAKRSIKTNALSHVDRRFVVNIDLKDFFPTITENRVQGVLTSIGINSRVAEIIARICCNNGHLPQGAPSSPVLSNMICFRLDKQLQTIAREARCIYTRYADDITFSSHQPPSALFEAALPHSGHFAPELFAPAIRAVFRSNSFEINPDKAHYADRYSRRMVTGLKVNELLNVDRRYVRNLRAALHCVEKLGVVDAEEKFHDKHRGKGSLAAHLQGKIAFLTHVKGRSDPVVRGIALRFNKSFPDRQLKVEPTAAEIRDRSVWIVDNDTAIEQGSAFFLKEIGLVTAAHCVQGASEVEVYHHSKPANKFKARVLKVDDDRDLALLEHDIPATEFFELSRAAHVASQGDHLTAIGYPGYGPGDRINARAGTVSSLTIKHGVELIEVTQTLTPGMSGGPLVTANDEVVGVIHKGGPDEGRNLAVDIKVLKKWLEE